MDKDGVYRKGKVILESGPRSIRPKGSKGAGKMLRLVRESHSEQMPPDIPTDSII
jgi:oxygen-dependent protoporphyrinogen oxidase